MTHIVGPILAAAAVIGLTFLPFMPGGYDALAVPLATIAWVAGHAGLLFVPLSACCGRCCTDDPAG